MDWNQVEGNWKEVKGKVKEKWAKLTDDDLTAIKAGAISSKVGCKSAMATPRIRSVRTSMIGFRHCLNLGQTQSHSVSLVAREEFGSD